MCLGLWSELGWVDSNALTAEFKESDPAQFIGDLSDEGDVPADYDSIAVGTKQPFTWCTATSLVSHPLLY